VLSLLLLQIHHFSKWCTSFGGRRQYRASFGGEKLRTRIAAKQQDSYSLPAWYSRAVIGLVEQRREFIAEFGRQHSAPRLELFTSEAQGDFRTESMDHILGGSPQDRSSQRRVGKKA